MPKQSARAANKVSWLIHNGGSLGPDDVVLHKCDNPPCVNPDHLFLGTQGDNNKDMTLKGRNPRAKITPETVLEIRELREEGLQHKEIAARVGLARNTVTNILNGKRWGYVTSENLGGSKI
jgi:DNA-binding NarL/FixJ family response regulator